MRQRARIVAWVIHIHNLILDEEELRSADRGWDSTGGIEVMVEYMGGMDWGRGYSRFCKKPLVQLTLFSSRALHFISLKSLGDSRLGINIKKVTASQWLFFVDNKFYDGTIHFRNVGRFMMSESLTDELNRMIKEYLDKMAVDMGTTMMGYEEEYEKFKDKF